LERGGKAVDDPLAWFDSLDDDVANLWDAYHRLEPFGNPYHRHAAEMEVLETMLAKLLNRDIPSERSDLRYEPRKRRDFMPADYAGERPKRRVKQADVMAQCEAFAEAIKQRK
jgi:chromatin segregation and condensation protein Rec8/ScpA/Scc1 (kleisin family)